MQVQVQVEVEADKQKPRGRFVYLDPIDCIQTAQAGVGDVSHHGRRVDIRASTGCRWIVDGRDCDVVARRHDGAGGAAG